MTVAEQAAKIKELQEEIDRIKRSGTETDNVADLILNIAGQKANFLNVDERIIMELIRLLRNDSDLIYSHEYTRSETFKCHMIYINKKFFYKG